MLAEISRLCSRVMQRTKRKGPNAGQQIMDCTIKPKFLLSEFE
jgi:hypothetical protein